MSTVIDLNDCVINVDAIPEEASIIGNASAIDEITDKITEYNIQKKLELGNDWAWCTVKVTVIYKGILTAKDYLGCCSYDSKQDFIDSEFYQDMVDNCIEELHEQLKFLIY